MQKNKKNNIIKANLTFFGGCYVTVKRNLNFENSFDTSKEKKIYEAWIQNKAFTPSNAKKTYFIPMPPPNITGKLHLGHALFLTLQDILTRYHRFAGYSTLWLPGTDHAGLATHEKIINQLKEQKIDYNKENYLKMAWEWTDTHKSKITNQIKAMGASCDWDRLRFTLDEKYKESIFAAIKKCEHLLYFKDGQWYLKMKDSANSLLNDINAGKIKIIPSSEKNQLTNFLNNIEDWCISRQIWWGQQMPIWYEKTNYNNFCIAKEENEASLMLNIPIDKIEQSQDSFDTWFSSSLYPFAILGWPEETKDFNKFYPAQIIETADDILFPWCARMLMMGQLCTKQYPFDTIYLHGIIRDKQGRKMAKGLGNGIDPIEIIEKYGADALRWFLATHTQAGLDMKINEQEFLIAKKFTNKIWQAGRFFHLYAKKFNFNMKDFNINEISYAPLKEIYENLDDDMSNYRFSQLSKKIQHIFKQDFCDNWIENNKKEIQDGCLLKIEEGLSIYWGFILLFHLFMPFISEEIWNHFFNESIMNKLLK